MTTLKRKWPFKEALVDDAPETAGLYTLWDNATLLYVGRAKGGRDTIRRRLLAHLERAARQPARAPTHYGWEIRVLLAA
jgi:excinuclease UvrABC nuclease subunit